MFFADFLCRTAPVCRDFGWERGTPIDRYYIEKFLDSRRELIRGCVLEVGDSVYTHRFGDDRIIQSDVLNLASDNPAATLVADLTNTATLPQRAFDTFVCTQTLGCIFDVRKAVRGIRHLLRPGGVFLGTVAGISQVSRWDMDHWGDYWRFTSLSVKRLFSPVFGNSLQTKSYGNALAATAFVQGIAVEDLPYPHLLDEFDPDYEVIIGIQAIKRQ